MKIIRTLLFLLFLTVLPACGQTVQQQGVVRKVTHSRQDPIVPISGVQVVVGGVSSAKSDARGQFSLSVSRNREGSYQLHRVVANRTIITGR